MRNRIGVGSCVEFRPRVTLPRRVGRVLAVRPISGVAHAIVLYDDGNTGCSKIENYREVLDPFRDGYGVVSVTTTIPVASQDAVG